MSMTRAGPRLGRSVGLAVAATCRARPYRVAPVAFAIAAVLLGACWRVWRAQGRMLWLDELYTTTLIGSPSLPHLYDAVLRGIDGNPPLFMSLAWGITHALPVDPVVAMRLLNLAALSAGAAALYGVARRFAAPQSAIAGLLSICALDTMPVFALLELRTYALYVAFVSGTVWATLRLLDRPAGSRVTLLAAVAALAALSHSFGGLYVATAIGGAVLVVLRRGEWRTAAWLSGAAAPAIALTLFWIRISLPGQMATATPYGWILPPDGATLVESLTGSGLLSGAALLAIVPLGLVRVRSSGTRGRTRPDLEALVVMLAGFTALTVAAWVGSQVITPFFTERYFIPNLLVAAILATAALEWARARLPPRVATVTLAAVMVLGGLGLARGGLDAAPAIPCLSGSGFAEDGIDETLPVVTESPHAWLPRITSPRERTTVLALDWAVVVRFPFKARNNAMDFHIMEALRDWLDPASTLRDGILTTEQILARYPAFLVVNEHGRSWLDNLRATAPVSAALLGQRGGCRLWRVEHEAAGPRR